MRPEQRRLDEVAEDFRRVRPRLLGLAARVVADHTAAEDIVQDAWLRWQRCDRSQVRNASAFLVTTTKHLALNHVGSARARREVPTGDWRVEPADVDGGPELVAERREDLELALRHLLEQLSATERRAYVLRTAFDHPYPVIARELGVSEANARQLVSRVTRRLAAPRPRRSSSPEEQRQLMRTFTDAARTGIVSVLIDEAASPDRRVSQLVGASGLHG